MRYRVDELAARAGLTVDTVRFYQGEGLLPAPEREGRIAWYADEHLERLERILELKSKGLTLGAIRRLLAGDLDAADRALIEALAGAAAGPGELLSLDELARRTGVSRAVIEAIEREGLLAGRPQGVDARYTTADAEMLSGWLELLEAGLPLSEFLALARDHHRAMTEIATRAVDLFLQFVRDPIRVSAADDDEAARRLVEAFHEMFRAISVLVAHHFERVLVAEGLARIEREGLPSEIDAIRDDPARARGTW